MLLLPIIYLGFISLGLPDGTLGVAWPAMHRELNLPIGLAGTLTLVGTVLAAVSSFNSGRIIARWRTGPVMMISCAITGTALLTIAMASNLAWLLVAALLLGLGSGAVDAGLNGFVARHYSGRHMNWLHACWGLGAMSGPLLMGYMLVSGPGWRGGFLAIASAQLALALLFFLTLGQWAGVPVRPVEAGGAGLQGRAPVLPANSFPGWLSAVIFALYVAVEATAGLWAASIMVVGRSMSATTAAIGAAVFYGTITSGRVLAGFIVDRWGNRLIVKVGSAIALVGAVLFALGGPALSAVVALGLMGLGFAPIYPCLMHEAPRRFAPEAVPTVIGRQSGAAYFGAALMPATAGLVAQRSLAGIPWLIIAGIIGLIAAIRVLDRRS